MGINPRESIAVPEMMSSYFKPQSLSNYFSNGSSQGEKPTIEVVS
jgi:hypothetical protein